MKNINSLKVLYSDSLTIIITFKVKNYYFKRKFCVSKKVVHVTERLKQRDSQSAQCNAHSTLFSKYFANGIISTIVRVLYYYNCSYIY